MLRYLCIVLLLFTAHTGKAQGSIKGSVYDTTGTPLHYCRVALYNPGNDKLLKGTITDEEGTFLLAGIPHAPYKISIIYSDHVVYSFNVIMVDSGKVTDLGKITVRDEGKALENVQVTAKRPVIEFKEGKVVLNVQNDILANGNTVFELLKRLPGVSVDAQDNILVNGRGNVGIMIDGRLQQLPLTQVVSILSGMPADAITAIELIKNPPAKYDASGTAGLINIVTKKVSIRGFSGNLFNNMGYGKSYGISPAISLNYKTNKLTFTSNFSYLNRDIVMHNTLDRALSEQQEHLDINTLANGHTYKSAINARMNIEYLCNKQTTLGFDFNTAITTTIDVIQQNTDISGTNMLSYNYLNSNIRNYERYNSPTYSVYLVHLVDSSGAQVKLSADYIHFTDHYIGHNQNIMLDSASREIGPQQQYNNTIDLKYGVFIPKLDCTIPMGKSLQMETGLRGSIVQNDNNSDLNILLATGTPAPMDSAFINRYQYKEQVYAGYVNFIKKIQNGSVQAGLRGEQTDIDALSHTTGYRLKRNYFNLYPSASIDYAIGQSHHIQLSYGYRIDRPPYYVLNPLRIYNDPLNYSAANPLLQPQYSHKATLEWGYKNMLNSSISYTYTINSLYNYSFTPNGSAVNIDTIFNFSFSHQLMYTLFVQQQWTKWFNMQASANMMYGVRNGMINDTAVKIATTAAFFTINNTLMLPGEIKVQINGVYYTPYKDGIQSYGARGALDLALQKRFIKNKLAVTLGIYDMFYTDNGSFTANLPGQSYYNHRMSDTRRVRLILNYRFGNMRIERKINDGPAEESGRLKK